MRDRIRRYIGETFMEGKGDPSDEQPLFTGGIIDSLGFVRLLAFLEETFSVKVDVGQITIENFDTVARIAGVVEGSRKV